jgi:hypothetical protein
MEVDYRKFFENWRNWDEFELRKDGINGVYAFRLKFSFARLRGFSHVLYIGMVNQNPDRNKRPGIWHRLVNYRQMNSGASKRLKDVEEHFGGRTEIEYAYCQCTNPREVEQALLEDYYLQHLELPPLNRAG